MRWSYIAYEYCRAPGCMLMTSLLTSCMPATCCTWKEQATSVKSASAESGSCCAEEHPLDQDMDIEKYLQTTEEEVDEEEEPEDVIEEDASLGKSASKKHPHIGMLYCLTMATAWAHASILLPKKPWFPGNICSPGEWSGPVDT